MQDEAGVRQRHKKNMQTPQRPLARQGLRLSTFLLGSSSADLVGLRELLHNSFSSVQTMASFKDGLSLFYKHSANLLPTVKGNSKRARAAGGGADPGAGKHACSR